MIAVRSGEDGDERVEGIDVVDDEVEKVARELRMMLDFEEEERKVGGICWRGRYEHHMGGVGGERGGNRTVTCK